MKYILTTIILASTQITAWACTVCQKQQPKLFKGITHGAGPESNWDYVIIGMVAAAVIGALYYSIRFLVRPGEGEVNHIKNSILTTHSYE
jgi:hypothetical protein